MLRFPTSKALVAILLCALTALSACRTDDTPDIPAERRTLIVFMPWTTNLTRSLTNNLNCLATAFARSGAEGQRIIVAQAVNQDEARLMELQRTGKGTKYTTLATYTARSLTTPDGMTQVFTDAMRHAPADDYTLVVGGHGMAWLPADPAPAHTLRQGKAPAAPPATAPEALTRTARHPSEAATRYFGNLTAGYQIETADLAAALTRSVLVPSLLVLDMCYGANVENLYQLRTHARYIIASETEIMAYGMPYDIVGPHLFGRPDPVAAIDKAIAFYRGYAYPYYNASVIRPQGLDSLALLVLEAQTRHTLPPGAEADMQTADNYPATLFYDLGDYMTHLCAADTPLLHRFRRQLARTVVHTVHTDSFYTNGGRTLPLRTYSGLTTSAPTAGPHAEALRRTEWYKATHP